MSAEKDIRNFLLGISENSRKYFECSTDKDPISYKAKEEMVFTLKAKADDKDIPAPFISVKCSGDDGKTSEEIIPANADGTFTVKTCCDRDGFVRVIATALDENQKEIEDFDKFEGGAGADVDKIKLCTPLPDDYFDFWEELRKEAMTFPRKVLYEKVVEDNDNFVVTDYRFETKVGKFLSLVTCVPKNAKPGTLKFSMSFMGYGVNTAPPNYARDTFSVTVNSHAVENYLTPEEYAEIKLKQYPLYGFDATENSSPKTSYWYQMYFRDLQAFFLFKDNELLNKKDYIFAGGSQGAMQASILALHTGYATICKLNVAGFCDLWAVENEKRMRGWRPDPSVGMNYYDTALAASFLKCPVYIEAGLGDYICPPSGQIAMYNAISAPKMIRFVQNQTHPYRPPVKVYSTLWDGYPDEKFHF